MRDVKAGRGVGCPGATGDETDPGPPRCLAGGLRHHRGTALLPADREREIAVVKRVEHGEITLARHAEHVCHAVNAELVDQNRCGGSHVVIGTHWDPPPCCDGSVYITDWRAQILGPHS